MSDPQTFASAILTSIAPGSGSGTGYSRISKGRPVPWNTASFAVSAISFFLLPRGVPGARRRGDSIPDHSFVRKDSRSAPHHEAAVHVYGLPGHVVGVGTGEERHHAGDVLGPLGTSQWDIPDPALPRLALSHAP